MFTSKKLTLAVQLGLAMSIGAAAPMALAQNADQSDQNDNGQNAQKMETVTVTGSRIRKVDVETQQPVFSVDREDIQETGLTTVGDILSHMTIQGTPTFNKQSVLAANPEQGGSYISMRNLGANRVLVLVNGKRWSTTNNGLTDLSTVPASVIDHIDVLKDGGSAIYGSDAVTGVINIITRQGFDGAEAHVQYGSNFLGDGESQNYSFTIGSQGENSSIMMALSYNKEGAIWDRDRRKTRYGQGPRHPTAQFSPFSPLPKYQDQQTGQIFARNSLNGGKSSDPSNYHPYTGDPADDYNSNQDMMYQIPTEQKSIFVQGEYDFTDDLTFKSTAMYTNRKANVQLAGYPLGTITMQAPKYGVDGLVSGDSIYNPTNKDVGFFHRTVSHPRRTRNDTRQMHLDATVEQYFNVGSHSWHWNVGANWNKYEGEQITRGNLNMVAAQKAIGPSFRDGNGVAHCGEPGDVVAGCTPWNVLAGPGAMTDEVANNLFVMGQSGYGSKQISYFANIGGGMFDFAAGGEAAFAAGVEHRTVQGYNHPDQFSQTGLSTDLASGPTQGKYEINAVYGEVDIPLLKDLPGARLLDFNIASRYSNYSNFGNTTNSKFSFGYKPLEDLKFRGTYAESFRAPTISDLYGGRSDTFDNYTDPCDANFGKNHYGQDVYNACINQLSVANPQDFHQTDASGNPVESPQTQSTTPFTSGSNPNLDPETSTYKTLGVVYSPRQVQGLSASLDWYQIKIEDVISGISANDVLKYCYQGQEDFCNQFSRNSDGQVVNLSHANTNIGSVDVEGWDFNFTYRMPETSIGQFQVSANAAYTSKYNTQTDASSPVEHKVGKYTSGGVSYWRTRANGSLDWRKGDFGATWTARFFSGLQEACAFGGEECNMPNYANPAKGDYPSRQTPTVIFHDLTAYWDAPWDARIRLGVNNIFDKSVPIQYAATNNAGSPPINNAYDIDRYWFVSYDQKF